MCFHHDSLVTLCVRDNNGRYQPATREHIFAAARQAVAEQYARGTMMSSPQIVRDYLQMKLCGFPHEVFAMLLLDTQHQLIEYVELFRGTIDAASVYPREVVKSALAYNAAAVIFSHCHPSGLPEPSAPDRTITQRLRDALALVDIRVLDHVVIGGLQSVSFAERGWV